MEFETPKWLTKEFIKNALETGKDYKVTIEDLKIKMPIPKGNNYVCDIFQSDIQYRKSNSTNLFSKSLIIKSPIKGPMYDNILKFGILQKETRIYSELSPKLKSIFCENTSEDHENDDFILPDSYSSTEENIVVLEDLKFKDYKMADRIKQFDYDHCVLALKSVAKFHAGSVILHEKEPEFIEDIGAETHFREDFEDMNKAFVSSTFKLLADELKNYPDLEKYSVWFKENVDNCFQSLVDCYKRKDSDFNVLNHGDFWVTNMLFKYNSDGVPMFAKLIDLQLSRYNSPVFDFIYLTEGSVQEQVRNDRYNDFIDVYLNGLNSVLVKYGSEKTLEKSDFEKSLSVRSFFRMYISITNLAFCIANPESTEVLDMSKTSEEDFLKTETNPMKGYFSNEKFIKIISKRLKEFEKMGIIKL